MFTIAAVLTVFLITSLVLNLYQRERLQERTEEIETLGATVAALKVKPPAQETYDVHQLIHDLSDGRGLVQITRIAPANVLLRSPRDL